MNNGDLNSTMESAFLRNFHDSTDNDALSFTFVVPSSAIVSKIALSAAWQSFDFHDPEARGLGPTWSKSSNPLPLGPEVALSTKIIRVQK